METQGYTDDMSPTSGRMRTTEMLAAARSDCEKTHELIAHLTAKLGYVRLELDSVTPTGVLPEYETTGLNHEIRALWEVVRSIQQQVNSLINEVAI